MNNKLIAFKRIGGVLGLGLVMVYGFLALVSPVRGSGVVGDGTPGSCTEAAFTAVFNSGGLVTFNCGPDPVVITLTVRYDTPGNATVNGGGLARLHATNSTGMFYIGPSEALTLTHLTLSGGRYHDHGAIENDEGTFMAADVTFQGMNAVPGSVSHSPAVWNMGSATLVDSIVHDNVNMNDAAWPAPVIYNGRHDALDASLIVSNTRFIANSGGGILTNASGPMRVISSTFEANTGATPGVYVECLWATMSGFTCPVTITDSIFRHNQANGSGWLGGAVSSGHGGATLWITNTQFISNTTGDNGGALYTGNDTQTWVEGAIFQGNTAANGGAIYNSGPITVTNSTFTGNTATANGGAMYVQGCCGNSGQAVVEASDFIGNRAAAGSGGAFYLIGWTSSLSDVRLEDNFASAGGGLYLFTGGLNGDHLVVQGNHAANGNGGGLALAGGWGNIQDSVIAGNVVTTTIGSGGGLYHGYSGTSTFVNVTFSGNHSNGQGGNVYAYGRLNLINNTVVNGVATTDGGNLYQSGVISATNTLVANGSAASGQNCNASLTSAGGNLENLNQCGFNQPTDQPNTDPRLGPLADNGGNTLTHLLLILSPAIDTAVDAACPVTDQRGITRPLDGDDDGTPHCDIGAIEVSPLTSWKVYLPLVLR